MKAEEIEAVPGDITFIEGPIDLTAIICNGVRMFAVVFSNHVTFVEAIEGTTYSTSLHYAKDQFVYRVDDTQSSLI